MKMVIGWSFLASLLIVLELTEVSGLYARIYAKHANGGRRGGGEMVVSLNSEDNTIQLKRYSPNDRLQQWEVLEKPSSNAIYISLLGQIGKRLTMQSSQTMQYYNLKIESIKQKSMEQQFEYQGGKIYCNGGKPYTDGYQYTLQYYGSYIGCGKTQGFNEEEMDLVSIMDVEKDENQFFIVNKHFSHAKLTQWGTGYFDRGTEHRFTPNSLWQLKRGTGSDNDYFYIQNTKHEGHRLAQYGRRYGNVSVFKGKFFVDQLWKFEKVEDNLGDEWDYYRIYNKKYPRHKLVKRRRDGLLGVFSGGDYEDQLWRLVPRYVAKDEGYVQISHHSGNPDDVIQTVTYTQGLTLSEGTQISTKFGMKSSIEAAIEIGPFSGSVKREISLEFGMVNTASAEAFSHKAITTKRIFRGGCDCRLLQKIIKYVSSISSDNLSHAPADFRMKCVRNELSQTPADSRMMCEEE